MAAYTVNFGSKTKYRTTLNHLHENITDRGWPNVARINSTAFLAITVRRNAAALVLFLRECDLYIVGFQNAAAHRFYFRHEKDPGVTGTHTVMAIGGSYTGSTRNNLGILDGSTRNIAWGGKEIENAMNTLGGFTSTAVFDPNFRVSIAISTYSISEAMRFNAVFAGVQGVIGSVINKFKFRDYEDLVLNWAKLSKGKHDELKKLKTRLPS